MRYHTLFALFMLSTMTFAQGFKVKNFKVSKSDDLAAINPRTDSQGRTCGLVKVTSKLDDLDFGNRVGKAPRSQDEYWVYLPDGAESFTITRPHYLPTTVKTADFGISCIISKTTYVMEVKEEALEMDKCGVTLMVKPASAQVKVDGISLKGDPNGEYQLLLAKGDHQCEFSAYGCRSASRAVTSGHGMQRMEVELESILADVIIFSRTEGAEILVNGEMKGASRWEGKMLPGSYTVEQHLKGYLPAKQTITLGEKEQKTLDLGALEHIKGTLHVSTQPQGCMLWIDGNGCGQAPCDVPGVIYGKHMLMAEMDSCGLKRKKEIAVRVEEEGSQEVSIEVATTDELNLHAEALELFRRAFLIDAKGESTQRYMPQADAKPTFDSIMNMMDQLDSTFFLHKEYFPEYEADALISPNQCIGDRMFMYYTYVDITEDEPIKLKGNVKYSYVKQPDKAIRIAQRMGKKLTRHELAYLAICYYRTGNYEKAIQWFQKWYEEGESLGETEDYYAGRCYFYYGNAYKQLGQSTEAKEWIERAMSILEKTEKNAVRLKKMRQIAKEA